MDRRSFLRSLLIGAPVVAVEPKLGLIEKAVKYFFAPEAGWIAPSIVGATTEQCVALQLEKVRHLLPTLFQNDEAFLRMTLHPAQYVAYEGPHIFVDNTTGQWQNLSRRPYVKAKG